MTGYVVRLLDSIFPFVKSIEANYVMCIFLCFNMAHYPAHNLSLCAVVCFFLVFGGALFGFRGLFAGRL